MKDLTVSTIERQNVLNNRFAVEEIQRNLDLSAMLFEGEYWLTKKNGSRVLWGRYFHD